MTWSYWALAAAEAVVIDGIGGMEFEFADSKAVEAGIVVPAAVVDTAALAVGAGTAAGIVEAGIVVPAAVVDTAALVVGVGTAAAVPGAVVPMLVGVAGSSFAAATGGPGWLIELPRERRGLCDHCECGARCRGRAGRAGQRV
jgi:hypothetical protein